ncbi:MAG: Ig-like domain repeat protein, partial [Anaerolineales bacterium]|nr:Ig-like domain repeat protein [Anaerolineales bacterium]
NAWPRTCLTYECMDASGNCGDPGDGGGGGPVYQPPTISHVLTCSNPGTNGWCIGTLSLDLTASDPQGQSIVISGTVNGVAFACPSGQTTCSIPLPEASGTATYKVDSATGLSANGSTSYHLDVTTPQISGDIKGSSGTNGWYISQTSVTASASDSLSGLGSLEVNVDNAGWASYSDTTFTDGMHTIQFRATDNAGNVTETAQQSINVDTTAPTLDLSTTGTTGQNGWYVSAITLTPTANDATSGLYSLEATTDGVTWTNVNSPITLTDGIYTVQFRATDNAGNVSQTPSQQIKVDATTPSLSLDISGTRGQNDWYISSVTVTPNASDGGSGINKVEASVNNGAWGTITSPLSFTDGVHSYKIRVTDNAGNFTETPVLPMMVDTVPPAIAIDDDTLDLGDTLNYDLEDSMSGLWINRSVIEDEEEKYKKIVWQEEITGNKSNDNEIRWDGVFADGTKAAPGQYFITLKISDQAGNETMRTAIVEVTAFNSILPIPAFTPPASTVTEPIPSEASTTNEQSFGGANNGNVGAETTTTNGETVFASVNIQAGGMNSFSSGNQTTSTPLSNPNILWGAAAAAMLGATLAEWQKKREEEAARLAALRNSGGGGDEEEEPSKKKSPGRIAYEKMMQQKRIVGALQAEQNAKAAQAQSAKIAKATQADMTQAEKLSAYKQTAGYIARQESLKEYERQKAMKAQRAGERDAVAIVEEYKARKQGGGGKPLAILAKQDDPPWWKKITNVVEQVWNVTKTASISAWNSTKSITTSAWNLTKTLATDFGNLVVETGKSLAYSFNQTVVPKLSSVWEDVTSIPSAIKMMAKENIPIAAEWLYQNITVPVVTLAEKHPVGTKIGTQMLNLVINSEKEKIRPFTDINPESMTWADLGKVWLYEYGNEDTIRFGSDAALTKEVMALDGVQSFREEVINNLRDDKIEDIIQKPVEYGVDKYVHSLSEAWNGRSGELFLGSYTVSIVVEPKGNGVYVLHYEVKNPSTWASATRFRDDMNNDHVHDAIIPDETPRGDGIELGGRLDEVFTWTEEIQIPNGGGR